MWPIHFASLIIEDFKIVCYLADKVMRYCLKVQFHMLGVREPVTQRYKRTIICYVVFTKSWRIFLGQMTAKVFQHFPFRLKLTTIVGVKISLTYPTVQIMGKFDT